MKSLETLNVLLCTGRDESMSLKLPIGIGDFKEVIEGGFFYADKTGLIEEVLNTSAKVQLITRPRRFGKTMNLSMLRYFFDIGLPQARTLFKGLAIENRPCFESLGRYPVIFLTFKDLKAEDFPSFLEGVGILMADLFREHAYLLEDLDEFIAEDFRRIARRQASNTELKNSLSLLMGCLHRHHQSKVILLLDEYDSPIHEGFGKGYYPKIIGFMRGLLGKALKDNIALEKAVVTGILRIARESIFSDLNNIAVFTLLNFAFADKFGFTEPETEALLERAGLSEKKNGVREWYNGYLMGETVIYNPWSILNYVAKSREGFMPHWVNTSSNDLIREQILHATPEIHDDLKSLLEGGSVETLIEQQTVFRDLNQDAQTLWSFFLFSGYLKVVSKIERYDHFTYKVAIPNLEVRFLFRDIIQGWLRREFGSHKLKLMLESLINGDFDSFGSLLSELVLSVLSYYDVDSRQPERVYHAFVLGMLVHLGGRYEIRSNRESGLGRYDVMMRPRDLVDRGVILEFKVAESKQDLESALDEGMAQIERRRYATELQAVGVTVRSEIAVAFCGKNVAVRGREIKTE